MKTLKIGELNIGKLRTEIFATQEVKDLFRKEGISLSFLIPVPWTWYDSELLEVTDENGDGKMDDRFGTSFKIIYVSDEESVKEFEQKSILTARTTIKNIRLKYTALKK